MVRENVKNCELENTSIPEMCQLAIVIPAYKSNFLQETLNSLANQTNKKFSVYVGNDHGDLVIQEIVEDFKDRLDIFYHYYNTNLGQQSLAKQWERCINFVQKEEWVWILPDDDYIDANCVELFFRDNQLFTFDLYRFNIHFVNEDGKVFKSNSSLLPLQDSFESLTEKLCFSRPSTIAEFIFRKSTFDRIGFKEIPMAWGTDDILWYLIGKERGIFGCNGAYVYLRQSHLNISNNYGNLAIQKIESNFIFFKKLAQTREFRMEMRDKKKKKYFNKIALNHVIINLQDFSLKVSAKNIFRYGLMGNEIWGGGIFRNARRFWLNNRRIDKLAKKLSG
jgi:glycosyltransferase involved in cell wall biosynthesis